MFKSMTAYVYKIFPLSHGNLAVEMQSVNRKHLEIITILPKELARMESHIKKNIGKRNSRGHITVRMSLSLNDLSTVKVKPNLPLARQIFEAWESIADHLGLDKAKELQLSLLKEEEGLLQYEEAPLDDSLIYPEILASLDHVLEEFTLMKQQEGLALKEDVERRMQLLKEWLEIIAVKASNAPERYRNKLAERLQEILPGAVENEERLLRELCIYADKVDIAEEITRFGSHIMQFEKMLSESQGASGKKMEFLIQEMLREANTIGSKSPDIEVSHMVVDIKGELEKVREQLQNVE